MTTRQGEQPRTPSRKDDAQGRYSIDQSIPRAPATRTPQQPPSSTSQTSVYKANTTNTTASSLRTNERAQPAISQKLMPGALPEQHVGVRLGNSSVQLPPTSIPDSPNATSMPSVLIFGETGTGKSSLINMIAGTDVAQVSNDALGCTFGNVGYTVNIDGVQFRLWDTAGLNEGEHGSVPAEQAMQNLQNLVQGLKDGINLLVYCIRGSRFRNILQTNYEIFCNIICQKQVRIVIIVTGLENEDPMDSWWEENRGEFEKRGMMFDGHACVTTTKGKQLKSGDYMFEDEYAESKDAVQNLIKTKFSRTPWKMDERIWWQSITAGLSEYYRRESAAAGTGMSSGRREDVERERGSTRRDDVQWRGGAVRGDGTRASSGVLIFLMGLVRWIARQ